MAKTIAEMMVAVGGALLLLAALVVVFGYLSQNLR